MEKSIFAGVVLVVLACFLVIAACEKTGENPVVPMQANISPGKIHNELLENIFSSLETRAVDPAKLPVQDKFDIAYEEQVRIAEKYGADAIPREDVEYYIEKGREYATMDPVMLAAKVLDEQEIQWFAAFMMNATALNARSVYDSLCRADGVPAPGSKLAQMLDIAVYSSEFWLRERKDAAVSCADISGWANTIGEPGSYTVEEILRQPWWKRILRFTTVVGVDAVSGILSGAGGGGVIGGTIIGGLASYGTDCLLWTDCD